MCPFSSRNAYQTHRKKKTSKLFLNHHLHLLTDLPTSTKNLRETKRYRYKESLHRKGTEVERENSIRKSMLREAIWPEPKDITDTHNRTEKNPGNMVSSPVPVWLKAVSQCTRKTKHLLWAALKRCFHCGHLSQDLSHDQHLRNMCWMLSNDNS